MYRVRDMDVPTWSLDAGKIPQKSHLKLQILTSALLIGKAGMGTILLTD